MIGLMQIPPRSWRRPDGTAQERLDRLIAHCERTLLFMDRPHSPAAVYLREAVAAAKGKT
jgi:hypothetical protein